MLGSNLAAHCFWIVKFKCWVGQEPWSKGLTHMTRGSIGLHERLVKITCHIWEREASKSSLSVPSCQQTFQFQLQKDKMLIMSVLHCICVTLRGSWSRLPSTTSRITATAQVLHWQRQDQVHRLSLYCAKHLFSAAQPPKVFTSYLLASAWNIYKVYIYNFPIDSYGTCTFLYYNNIFCVSYRINHLEKYCL